MNDSIEAELLAARHLRFGGDEPAWTDRYVTSLSRLDPSLAPAEADAAARRGVALARLGAPGGGRLPRARVRAARRGLSAAVAAPRPQRMLPVWPSE
jgi:hypothetical protein